MLALLLEALNREGGSGRRLRRPFRWAKHAEFSFTAWCLLNQISHDEIQGSVLLDKQFPLCAPQESQIKHSIQ